jgi:spore germination protein
MLREQVEHALDRVRQFEDIFDQVIFMCHHVLPGGSLPADWPASERKGLIDQFRAMGVSVLNDYSSVAETFEEFAFSAETSRKLIANLVADCEETGADGVDIDFEQVPTRDRFAFTEFMVKLSEELHARGKMLSVCTGAPSRSSRRDGGIGFAEFPALARYVDHLRPMNYDLFGPWAPEVVGPTSTAAWARERMTYLAAEVPKHKIVMGLPSYSLDWDLTEPTRSRQVYDADFIAAREKDSANGRHWIPHWDVSLVRYTDADDHIHLLYITDARSTRSHLETTDILDLAGVCFWALWGDDPAIWECVRRHLGRA